MGIFSRLSDIVNSNLNAMCDSAEDPEKMIRLIIQEMEDTLVEVRSASARILADKKTQERQLRSMKAQATTWEEKAKLALSKDREDLARAALHEKRRLESDVAALEGELVLADEHIEQLYHEVAQLQSKLDDARAKRKAILMRADSVSQRRKTQAQIHRNQLDDAFERFERFERRVDGMEGELEAMNLGRGKPSLADEIDALATDDMLSEELEVLKQSMEVQEQSTGLEKGV
ncbi:MAG: phage shock protein PspA [Luminiphilus sp.]|nr:phage shock protein PspA [Luminiphilus sp.]